MKYLLDTCIVEALLKAEPGHEMPETRSAGMTPEALDAYVRTEVARFAKVVKDAGV